MRIGTGVEYDLPTAFPLIATLYLNYMHGFLSTDEIHITNSIPEVPDVNSVTYNGSAWSLDVGIKIPFRFGEWGKRRVVPERE